MGGGLMSERMLKPWVAGGGGGGLSDPPNTLDDIRPVVAPKLSIMTSRRDVTSARREQQLASRADWHFNGQFQWFLIKFQLAIDFVSNINGSNDSYDIVSTTLRHLFNS